MNHRLQAVSVVLIVGSVLMAGTAMRAANGSVSGQVTDPRVTSKVVHPDRAPRINFRSSQVKAVA